MGEAAREEEEHPHDDGAEVAEQKQQSVAGEEAQGEQQDAEARGRVVERNGDRERESDNGGEQRDAGDVSKGYGNEKLQAGFDESGDFVPGTLGDGEHLLGVRLGDGAFSDPAGEVGFGREDGGERESEEDDGGRGGDAGYGNEHECEREDDQERRACSVVKRVEKVSEREGALAGELEEFGEVVGEGAGGGSGVGRCLLVHGVGHCRTRGIKGKGTGREGAMGVNAGCVMIDRFGMDERMTRFACNVGGPMIGAEHRSRDGVVCGVGKVR